jgi:glycosyltransferase involved in cell wall biosynthesis
MKLYYIANIRMPTERAHGIQIMEMCKAFSGLGHEVELIVPERKTEIADDPFVFYDIEESFEIKKLWCLDLVRLGRVGFWIESLTFATSVLIYSLGKNGLYYTRDELMSVLLESFGKRTVWEAHRGQTNLLVRLLIKMKVKIVVITESLKGLYMKLGIPETHIYVAPDGADIDRFDLPLKKSEARAQLGLPRDKTIVLYKGSLEAWKGAGTIAEAARYTNSPNLQFVFIGGKPEDVEKFKKEFEDVPSLSILGNRPRKETPIYQKAADILVIPNSAKEDISKLYTSPMKLFGYMAGGVPIIASDLPSLREILNESRAYFFTPDDPQSLASTIDTLLAERDAAEEKAKEALEEVRQYSWKNRAQKILAFAN